MNRRNILFFLTIAALYIAAFGQFSYNHIALYVFWPMAFFFSGFNVPVILRNKYFRYYLILWVFFLISWIFAINQKTAALEIRRMLGVAVAVITIFSIGRRLDTIPWLYGAFMVYFCGMYYYIIQNGLLNELDIETGRLQGDGFNANNIGYYLFYLTFSVYMLGEIVEKDKLRLFYKWLFLVLVPLSWYVALSTGSRQVLIIQIPTFAILLFLRYFYRLKLRNLVAGLLLVLIVSGLFGSSVSNTYENSLLAARYQSEVADDARTHHIKTAINIGIENPVVGVGPGCYKEFTNGFFSHCTYTEIFANYGVLAAIFFIFIIGKFSVVQWKRFVVSKDKMYLSFLTFGLIFALDNLFYVFYTGMWLMAFFFIVTIHSELYYRKQCQIYR